MAKETLTVDLDAEMVDRVRQYSREHGTDVACILTELIAALPVNGACSRGGSVRQNGKSEASATKRLDGGFVAEETSETQSPLNPSPRAARGEGCEEEWVQSLPPITRQLLGVAPPGVDEHDYKEYLWQKYGR